MGFICKKKKKSTSSLRWRNVEIYGQCTLKNYIINKNFKPMLPNLFSMFVGILSV